jgi:hypothetical protein
MSAAPPESGALRAEVLSLAVRECEEACRAHAAACLAGADAVGPSDADREECINLILDCAYTSSATARALRHFDRGDLEVAVMLVAACARLAARCGAACERHAAVEALWTLASASRECASACAAVLDILRVRAAVEPVAREAMVGGSAA